MIEAVRKFLEVFNTLKLHKQASSQRSK